MWIDRLTQAVVLLLLVFATQGNNPYDHQAKTKKSCPGNHRHHLPSRESDQPPNGNSYTNFSITFIIQAEKNGSADSFIRFTRRNRQGNIGGRVKPFFFILLV
jgi:hypothetical protein